MTSPVCDIDGQRHEIRNLKKAKDALQIGSWYCESRHYTEILVDEHLNHHKWQT